MNTTSVSLLKRLRSPAEQEAWARFIKLYTPLLYHWARGAQLSAQVLPGWLRTITLNKWREKKRKRSLPVAEVDLARLAGKPGSESVAAFEEAEYRQYLVRRALELMQAEFQPATWKACWECVVKGRSSRPARGRSKPENRRRPRRYRHALGHYHTGRRSHEPLRRS